MSRAIGNLALVSSRPTAASLPTATPERWLRPNTALRWPRSISRWKHGPQDFRVYCRRDKATSPGRAADRLRDAVRRRGHHAYLRQYGFLLVQSGKIDLVFVGCYGSPETAIPPNKIGHLRPCDSGEALRHPLLCLCAPAQRSTDGSVPARRSPSRSGNTGGGH